MITTEKYDRRLIEKSEIVIKYMQLENNAIK